MEEKNKEIQQPESENAKKGISGKKKAAAIAGFSLVGLAALVLIATLLVTFFGSGSTVTEAKVTQFKNEKQIAAKLKSVIKTSNKLYKSDANYIKDIIDNSAPQDEESDSASEIEQALNNHSAYTQTNSESEADTVKLDGKYIYYLSSEGGNKISVFTAEGEDSKFVCEIGIDNNESESFSFKEFFVDNKKLVAIEEELVKISATPRLLHERRPLMFQISKKSKKSTSSLRAENTAHQGWTAPRFISRPFITRWIGTICPLRLTEIKRYPTVTPCQRKTFIT